MVCRGLCAANWSVDGKFLAVSLRFGPMQKLRTYLFPMSRDGAMPKLPPQGLGQPEDLKKSSKSTPLPNYVDSMLGPEKYAYTRQHVRRNIYRIPIP